MLKEKYFWTLKIAQECIEGWKQFLNHGMKQEILSSLRCGIGKLYFFTMSFGTLLKVLVQRYGFRVVYDLVSNYEDKVDSVLKDKTQN